MAQTQAIKINRFDISKTEKITFARPRSDNMADGTVLLHLDIFSLSTNNITYAVTGNSLKYWDFFPVDASNSLLPVWGFGNVIASTHPEVAVGKRFYGYYPMSSHVLVQPAKVNAFGFMDANPTRSSNNPIYDHYLNIKSDAAYRADDEAMHALFRPLFMTSFLLNDFLEENESFGAEQILITSASSKTAYGLATILHEQKNRKGTGANIVALTSAGNVEFVAGLGIYDEIITYEAKDKIDNSKRTTIIDFTGNQKMLKDVAAHLGAAHAYTSLIGAVQNDRLDDVEGALKHGQFFFAPIQAQKCVARFGHKEFNQEYSSTLDAFIQRAKVWITLEEVNGAADIEKTYLDLLKHSPSPKQGLIAHF